MVKEHKEVKKKRKTVEEPVITQKSLPSLDLALQSQKKDPSKMLGKKKSTK
jgi:hypothetical protein